jgi:drug/metabolite transporter (DMT)-like permease
MTVVAPVAGIVTAIIPAAVGLALGNRPGLAALIGIAIALPAVALISRHPEEGSDGDSGVPEALIAGACFSLLLIGLDRAGTSSGTWPLVSGQLVAVIVIAMTVVRVRGAKPNWTQIAPLAAGAGLLGGIGNILFLNATGRGQLAVVAVITSLYPAATVLLARVCLRERLNGIQKLGLVVAALAVVLISL